jgi:ethanolaminephosphotransferase
LTWVFFALAALRITRSWNQTGQKFAGEPDIVKTFIVTNPHLLWVILTVAYMFLSFRTLSYLNGLPYYAATSLSSVLLTTAYAFKLDFTREDAPELVVGFARSINEVFQGQSLLWRARTVFLLLAALWAFGVYRAMTGPRAAQTQSGKALNSLYFSSHTSANT